jgi:hypothetical protein
MALCTRQILLQFLTKLYLKIGLREIVIVVHGLLYTDIFIPFLSFFILQEYVMYTDACRKCRSCSYFFCVYFLDNMGLYIRNYVAKCNKKLPRVYNMALPEKNFRPIGRGVPNYRCVHTGKNAQVVTNLQQTCTYSNAVPTTCQQDVFALLVPSLLTSCQRLVDNLLQSC